jgi:Anti-sigma-K factor rskA
LSSVEHIREEDLELFALGALPEEGSVAASAHAAGCAECAKKLAAARGRAAALAFGLKQEKPAAAAKAKLFARIAAEREGKSGEAAKRPDQVAPARREVMSEGRTRNWWNWVLVPLATSLALVSLGLWRENERLVREVREARLVAARLQEERVHVERLVHVLTAPETITVKLAGTADASQSSGVVKYNERTGTVIYTAELPGLPPDKVYQMWLVPANGAPISAGVFSQAESGKAKVWSAEVPANTEPKAFAVTIEPAGGVPQPTGPKVLLGAT